MVWNNILSRIDQIERKLTQKGIKVRLDNLKKIKNLAYISHINATLDFIDRIEKIFGQLIKEVDVEPIVGSGDVDLLMRINGEIYSFQIKARDVVGAYAGEWIKGHQWLNEYVLDDFGTFARLVKRKDGFEVLEMRKVSSVDDYSIAAVFEPIFRFKRRELNAIRKKVNEGSDQLKDSYGYKILVYDVRFAPILTEILIEKVKELFKKYDTLSGIILMRLGMGMYSRDVVPYLIPIPNHNSKKPLDRTFCKRLIYSQLDVELLEPRWLLSLPIKIDFRETGWQEFLDVRPGYRVFRKGVYMGPIFPPY
jgi:hypothetical protein